MPTYLRENEDIDATEWAKYYKAKRTMCNKKLAAMLPSYIKAELFKPPKPVVIDMRMVLPRAGLFTPLWEPVRKIPDGCIRNTQAYVAKFNELNGPYA